MAVALAGEDVEWRRVPVSAAAEHATKAASRVVELSQCRLRMEWRQACVEHLRIEGRIRSPNIDNLQLLEAVSIRFLKTREI